MDGYDQSTYGERFAEVYDDWYDDDPTSAVEYIADLARASSGTATGRIVELGAGTGRLAIPLGVQGFDVSAIDSSPAMIEKLHEKDVDHHVVTLLADMARFADKLSPQKFDVAVIARNTLFNLTSEEAQRDCLRAVAAVLAPSGVLIVEAFVPETDGPSQGLEVREIAADRVVLFVHTHDAARAEVRSSFIDITPAGVAFKPCQIRYMTTAELDRLAGETGLKLVVRSSDWAGTAFDDTSANSINVFALASGET